MRKVFSYSAKDCWFAMDLFKNTSLWFNGIGKLKLKKSKKLESIEDYWRNWQKINCYHCFPTPRRFCVIKWNGRGWQNIYKWCTFKRIDKRYQPNLIWLWPDASVVLCVNNLICVICGGFSGYQLRDYATSYIPGEIKIFCVNHIILNTGHIG